MATPSKPKKRTVPPIINATIPTYFRSLLSDVPDMFVGTLFQSISSAKLDDIVGKPN